MKHSDNRRNRPAATINYLAVLLAYATVSTSVSAVNDADSADAYRA
jgi:hypothetical protein